MDETSVVTCFLRNRGEVLLRRRSDAVGSDAGRWDGVSGRVESGPDRAVREEMAEAAARETVAEETGLLDACTLVRAGTPFPVERPDGDARRVIHPYLFDCDRRVVEPSDETGETDETEWVHPTEMLRRETVPELWAAYSRVAPTIEAVADDAEHGSAYLSVRALEVLRDRAGSFAARGTGDWSALAAIAERLVEARPSMAAVGNRANRAMAEASGGGDAATSAADERTPAADERTPAADERTPAADERTPAADERTPAADERTPSAVERAAREGIDRALHADERAADRATDEIRDATVLTLSRSGTLLDALPAADAVFVAESRPTREGVGVAEAPPSARAAATHSTEVDVTLHTDAAAAHVLATEDVDAVVVGADAILPDGRVVNKTGTRAAALAAAREGVPTYAVAASDKVRTDDAVHLEDGDPAAVYDGDADVAALNPTFDVTPADLVSGVVTERGVLDAEGVREVADELRKLVEWRAQ